MSDNRGTYVSITFDNALLLREKLKPLFPYIVITNVEDMHITMMYAKNQPFVEVEDNLHGRLIKLENPRLSLFDIWNSPSKKVLVLEFDNLFLQDEHRRIKIEHRLRHSYDIFRPHITLDVDTRIKDPDTINEIKIPKLPRLVVREEISAPIKEDYWEKRGIRNW